MQTHGLIQLKTNQAMQRQTHESERANLLNAPTENMHAKYCPKFRPRTLGEKTALASVIYCRKKPPPENWNAHEHWGSTHHWVNTIGLSAVISASFPGSVWGMMQTTLEVKAVLSSFWETKPNRSGFFGKNPNLWKQTPQIPASGPWEIFPFNSTKPRWKTQIQQSTVLPTQFELVLLGLLHSNFVGFPIKNKVFFVAETETILESIWNSNKLHSKLTSMSLYWKNSFARFASKL